MPQSIYEGQKYIGETIQNRNAVPAWVKAPVWNWVHGRWVQLNAPIGPVDFDIMDLYHNRALVEVFDWDNFDHTGPYEVSLKTGAGAFVRRADLDIPDNNNQRWITGLAASTSYTVRIRVALVSGGFTPNSDRTFTTPANPVPHGVIDLRSTAQSNAWIDLAWTNPVGTTASFYRVFYGRAGEGPLGVIQLGPGVLTARVSGLAEDTRYWYFVRGVNSGGMEGPDSNRIQWATGWGEIRRQGSDSNLLWKPREWGSWRPDIKWEWERRYERLPENPHLYQGYWPGDNWVGASNPESNVAAGKLRRYWGCVVYSKASFKEQLDAKHGAGVGDEIVMTKTMFRRLYRHRRPGYEGYVDLVWYLTNTNPFTTSSQPPIYDKWTGGKEMKAGEKIESYRLDPTWGTKLIRGFVNGTAVNGIALHRTDNVTNGYGAGGYGRWSGHLLKDVDYSDSWRTSDLSLLMEGSWSLLVRAYRGPYQW